MTIWQALSELPLKDRLNLAAEIAITVATIAMTIAVQWVTIKPPARPPDPLPKSVADGLGNSDGTGSEDKAIAAGGAR